MISKELPDTGVVFLRSGCASSMMNDEVPQAVYRDGEDCQWTQSKPQLGWGWPPQPSWSTSTERSWTPSGRGSRRGYIPLTNTAFQPLAPRWLNSSDRMEGASRGSL